MVSVGYDLPSSLVAVEQSESLPGVFAAVGVHPQDARTLWSDEAGPKRPASDSHQDWARDPLVAGDRAGDSPVPREGAIGELRSLAASPRVVAIGETGLDFYRNLSDHESQRASFRDHLRLARELRLPVIVHDRDAHEEVLHLLEEEGAGEVSGVLHCFSGDVEVAARAVSLGFHIGVAGSVTYPKANRLREVVAAVPSDRLLIETDCPWLAPQSHRGNRNEPAYVVEVAQGIAEIKGVSLQEVASATTANARQLFRLPS